jgi:hypothetical protein
MHDPIQLVRCENLHIVLRKLGSGGVRDLSAQANYFRIETQFLQDMVDGEFIPAVFARDVEWTMGLHAGWMDESHLVSET